MTALTSGTPLHRGRICAVSSPAPSVAPTLRNSALVRAARREPVPHTPVWFMRQAGRSLPEYRKVREGIADARVVPRPDLVTEITLQPVRRHGVDAAIFFSDIVVPLKADRRRPRHRARRRPGRRPADPHRAPTSTGCAELDPRRTSPYITEAVRLLTAELGATPLIGFAGAPFTLASLPRRGRARRKNHEHTKALMYGDPRAVARPAAPGSPQISGDVPAGAGRGRRPRRAAVRLLGRRAAAGRLRGARAAALGGRARGGRRPRRAPHPLRRRHRRAARARWARPAPTSSASTAACRSTEASRRLGPDVCRAGQPRPGPALRAVGAARGRACARSSTEGRAAPGHIFNLGHGVLPDTDPDVLTRVVELVHEASSPRLLTRRPSP